MKKPLPECTLIVWSNQEEVKLYVIPNSEISPERERLLKRAAGNWLNASDDIEGTEFLSNALCDKIEYCGGGDPKNYCIWHDLEISNKDAAKQKQNITRVISSGFWL